MCVIQKIPFGIGLSIIFQVTMYVMRKILCCKIIKDICLLVSNFSVKENLKTRQELLMYPNVIVTVITICNVLLIDG